MEKLTEVGEDCNCCSPGGCWWTEAPSGRGFERELLLLAGRAGGDVMCRVFDAVAREEGVDLFRPYLCDSMDGLGDQELSVELFDV